MTKRLLSVFLLICSMVTVTSAQPKLTLADVAACENSKAEVAVNVAEFYDVAAFTLYVQIDTAALAFDTLTNPNNQLSGGTVITSLVTWDIPTVIITWTSLSPANIDAGKLFDLNFEYLGGTTSLDFSDNCEIVLSDLSVVEDAVLNNGMVYPLINITGQPLPYTALEGEQALFSVLQTGGTSFQWQENCSDAWEDIPDEWPYSGENTEQLNIAEVPLDFDGNRYRCLIMTEDCEKMSDDALLDVTPLTITKPIGVATPGLIRVYPLPCKDVMYFQLNKDLNAFRLQLFDLSGRIVLERKFTGMAEGKKGSISLDGLKAGMYQLKILRDGSFTGTAKVLIR